MLKVGERTGSLGSFESKAKGSNAQGQEDKAKNFLSKNFITNLRKAD